MPDEVPIAEQSKADAVARETTAAEEKAHRKVKKRVEKSKPGPTVEHVSQGPDTNPVD